MFPSFLAFALPVVLFLTFWALCYTPLAGLARAVTTGLKSGSAWIARSRVGQWAISHSGPIGPYASILLVMAFGAIAAIGAGYLFGELAEQVRLTASAVYRADQAIHSWFGYGHQPAMIVLLRSATTIGSVGSLAAIVVVMAVVLLVRKERASAIFVVVTAGVGALLNLGLKMIFARARPDPASALAVAGGYSFPSGHAMDSFITFGALVCIALRQPWPWKAKSAVLAIALTMVVLVGLSRVYLGVHWASDIAGGWSAGTVWLSSAVTAFEMLLRLRQRRRGGAPTSPSSIVPDEPTPTKQRAST
jgi:undecaprenyl-diphosphatase